MGVLAIALRKDVTVTLRTEDPILEEQILQNYPGILKGDQCKKEVWYNQDGELRVFTFTKLEKDLLERWLAEIEKDFPRHPSTTITRESKYGTSIPITGPNVTF